VSNAKTVLVIGCGRFGSALTKELWNNRAEIIVVDRSERAVDALKGYSHAAFVADATDIEALDSAGVRQVDAAVVALGDSFEAAVLTVSALERWGVGQIIARATTDEKAAVLRAVGATRVHQIEAEAGERAALDITARVATDLIDFANEFRVLPWTAAGVLVGKSLRDSGLRESYQLSVLGIRPADQQAAPTSKRLMQPGADYIIAEGDTLLLVGEDDDVHRFVTEVGR